MITTNFNPYAARAYNMSTARQKQNNVAFERDFFPEEIQGLKEDEENVINDVVNFIGMKHIKPEDLSQGSKTFLEKYKHLDGVQYVAEILNKYAKK